MKRIWAVARREWLEQVRQPGMLGVIGSLYLLVAGLVIVALLMLQIVAADERSMALLGPVFGGLELSPLVGLCVSAYSYLTFTQFLGIAAVLAGHAVLHDRQVGALVFLLLAPLRRAELLAGKVLGAMGPAFALYVLISGLGSFVVAALPVTAEHSTYTAKNPAWWVAFLVAGPSLTLFVSTLCAIVSSFARDVRTAQQVVWFIVFFATLGGGLLVTGALPSGVGAELGTGLLGLFGTVLALQAGAIALSRDLGR